jgi:hypothetical protein
VCDGSCSTSRAETDGVWGESHHQELASRVAIFEFENIFRIRLEIKNKALTILLSYVIIDDGKTDIPSKIHILCKCQRVSPWVIMRTT